MDNFYTILAFLISTWIGPFWVLMLAKLLMKLHKNGAGIPYRPWTHHRLFRCINP